MQITAVQVRAAYDVLGLDHDLTLGVTISPGYIHVTTAETREGEVPNVDA